MKNDGISTIYKSDKILHKVGSRKGKTKAEIAKREDSIKASVKKKGAHMNNGKFVQVGKARLKPNDNSANLAPTHKGTFTVDVETLQNLIDKSSDGKVYFPLAAWLKVSKFNDEQFFIDVTSSLFVSEK